MKTTRTFMLLSILSVLLFVSPTNAFASTDSSINYEDFFSIANDVDGFQAEDFAAQLTHNLEIDIVKAVQTDTVDYHTMFEMRNQIDDGQVEGYYYELSTLFDDDPDAFMEALAKEDERTARELAFPLAVEHQSEDSAEDYQNALNSGKKTADILKHGVLIFTATNKSIDEKVFGNRCYEEMQTAYRKDHRLFLLSVAEYAMSDSYLKAVSKCLTHRLADDDLIALDKQLYEDAKCDWADENVKIAISAIQDKIDERIFSPKTGDGSLIAVSICMAASMALVGVLVLRKRILL